jgi:hypothetical protein
MEQATVILSVVHRAMAKQLGFDIQALIIQAYINALFHRRLQRLKNLQMLDMYDKRPGGLTSNSIFASATSASLPPPSAIFCASAIWCFTAYSR